MLAAFTYRDFRVQWFGACSSSIGTWMQLTAQNWMVLSLTGSAFYLGLDAFLQQLPIMLFTLIGGVLADRHDRRRTLLASQYIQMATAATLAAARLLRHRRDLAHPGCSRSRPASRRHSAARPISRSSRRSSTRKICRTRSRSTPSSSTSRACSARSPSAPRSPPSRAGDSSDPQAMAACFALNALSFLVVIWALMSLHVKHIPPTGDGSMRDELRSGLSYVRNHGSLVALIVLAATTTFLGFAVLTFLPLFTQTVFNEGAQTYSHLLAFSGAGSVAGALVVAWLGKFPRMGLTALVVQVVYGLLILAFADRRTCCG